MIYTWNLCLIPCTISFHGEKGSTMSANTVKSFKRANTAILKYFRKYFNPITACRLSAVVLTNL